MEPSAEIVSQTDPRSIDILNDDCLLYIFKFLPIEDRFRIEEVCKRWQFLSLKSWSEYKVFILSQSNWGLTSRKRKSYLNHTFTQLILRRCARYLTTIDLSYLFDKTEYQIKLEDLRAILKQSPNVETLYFTCDFKDTRDYRIVDWLKPYCKQFTKFGYSYHFRSIPDDQLFELLASMTKLKHLYIDSVVRDTFLDFVSVENIEELILENCGSIALDVLARKFKNSTKLHTLCASGITVNDELTIPSHSTIRNLGLIMIFMSDDSNWANSISQFVNIEKLNIEMNDNIDDDFLIAVAKNCKQITFLNIGGCSRITSKSISTLQQLPKLRYLTMSCLVDVTGIDLGVIPNLELLNCNNCRKITNGALMGIVQHSSFLRILILNNCPLITNKLMRAAINVTRKRVNGLILNVAIDLTGINMGFLKRKSPLLKTMKFIYSLDECNTRYNAFFPGINDYYTTDANINYPQSRNNIRIIMH